MKEETLDYASFGTGIVIGAFAMLVFLMLIGADARSAAYRVRTEAIEHNAAHWTIDPKTGDKQFTWNSHE